MHAKTPRRRKAAIPVAGRETRRPQDTKEHKAFFWHAMDYGPAILPVILLRRTFPGALLLALAEAAFFFLEELQLLLGFFLVHL